MQAQQDRAEQNERTAAEWARQLDASVPQPLLGASGVRVSLDYTEGTPDDLPPLPAAGSSLLFRPCAGPHRVRKKLLVEKVVDAVGIPQGTTPATPRSVAAPASPEGALVYLLICVSAQSLTARSLHRATDSVSSFLAGRR